MLKKILERICELTGGGQAQADQTFREAGIDSVTIIQLLVELEEAYGIEFGDDALNVDGAGTIADFARAAEKTEELSWNC